MQRVLLLIVAVLIPLVLSGQQVATVSAAGGPLKINGIAVPTTGVPNWPLATGDEITTTTNPAVILFRDGTRIAVGRDARARLGGGGTYIDLLAGSAAFKTASPDKFSMTALGRPVSLQARSEGVVSVAGPGKVMVRDKHDGDDPDDSKDKVKKPKPRSDHDPRDDDRR